MDRRRVVITGTGVISPLGNTVEELYARLRNGESGVREMREWKESGPPPLAAPVELE